MTKKRVSLLICCMFIVGGCLWWWQKPVTLPQHSTKTLAILKPETNEIQDRQVINKDKVTINRLPASVSFVNKPSADWEKKLTQSLKAQAGNSLKELEIKKERSLVWTRDENALLVESVVVSMTNTQDVSSSFRALVDSQTGKVLETWDRTIFDPMDKSGEFKFKLDPRYSN